MAALGAVAAGEYLANREEAGDEARIAAMQGQSMGLPGGAPPGSKISSPNTGLQCNIKAMLLSPPDTPSLPTMVDQLQQAII